MEIYVKYRYAIDMLQNVLIEAAKFIIFYYSKLVIELRKLTIVNEIVTVQLFFLMRSMRYRS